MKTDSATVAVVDGITIDGRGKSNFAQGYDGSNFLLATTEAMTQCA